LNGMNLSLQQSQINWNSNSLRETRNSKLNPEALLHYSSSEQSFSHVDGIVSHLSYKNEAV